MRVFVDRALSVILAFAAIAIAAVLVHREFFGTSSASGARPGKPTYISTWPELIRAGRVLGNEGARAKIIEFADLECPFCRGYSEVIRKVRAEYPKDLALVFVHFPLGQHRFARAAARAAECANSVGKFAEFVETIYDQQQLLGIKSWGSFALSAGIPDTSSFVRCAADSAAVPAVEAGVALARALGINSTPTILLNGWRYPSPPSDTQLIRAVGDLLRGRQPYPGGR